MNIPVLKGLIRRRLLVNFRVDPELIQIRLPQPFRPKLQAGHAMVGVCLIRLEQIRPVGFDLPFGINSENAAHRIAVTWQDASGQHREGVYIPRRDTDALINSLAGGRIFPGQHHLASFKVREGHDRINLAMRSRDHRVEVRLAGQVAQDLPPDSCFTSLEQASAFFEAGSLGYSSRQDSRRLDGLWLRTQHWRVQPLQLDHVYASYFQNGVDFPPGSAIYDHTLLMRNVPHEWHVAGPPAEALEPAE